MITLCLVMIVKNESAVILRCLNSVVDYLDSYCICDTGSTDDTREKIREFFDSKGIKGKLLQHEWKNFGHNRSLAVQAAKGMGDYLLLMDADFIFKVKNPDFKRKPYVASSMLIKYDGILDYRQPLMVRGDLDWRYIGVTHEYIHCPNTTRALCDDFVFQHVGDGANKNDKFERDIAMLEDGLKEEPDNMRYWFYKAQSHKDLAGGLKHKWSIKKRTYDSLNARLQKKEGIEARRSIQDETDEVEGDAEARKKLTDERNRKFLLDLGEELKELERDYMYHFGEAVKCYSIRMKKFDFPEEVYFSIYMAGHCEYHMGSEPHIYTGYFLQAYAYRPQRLEALYQLVKYYRLAGKYALAYDLGIRAADQPYPKNDCLFIDSRIHKYQLKHEVAISAYYLGDYKECLRLLDVILAEPELPEGHRITVKQHKLMTEQKISEKSKLLDTHKDMSQQTGKVKAGSGRKKPLITFFSYNLLGTGGSEISDWGLLQYLAKEAGYVIKHSRDFREIYQDKPDLILAQQYAIEKGVEVGAELDIPVIVTQHGPSQWGAARRSNYFIFNSYHVAETEIPRAQFEHFDIVYPRIDCDKYLPIGARVVDPNNGEVVNSELERREFITFLGRPTKAKGIELFFNLAKKMSQNKFLFVGGKPPAEEWSGDIPLNVQLRDFTTKPWEIYEVSRVVIVPSHYEAFGMVAVEASLCGVPVVATELPGLKEATSGLGNYVDSLDDVDRWEKAVLQVLNPDEYAKQLKNAIKIGRLYQEAYIDQISRVKYNIDRLFQGEQPCPYTRGMTFSITISVFNRPELVERALESVKWQTYRDWEVIVVDDCSTDKSTWSKLCDIHRRWTEQGLRIRLVQNEINRGTFYCRNVGIKEAEGDFIVNLDSDDMLIPSALERLKDFIWKNDARIVQFKYWRDHKGEILEAKKIKDMGIAERLDQIADTKEKNEDVSWGLFCFNKSYVVQYVGFYDPIRYGADTEFMCRLKNFHHVHNLDQIIYYASQGSLSSQITKEWSNQYLRNFLTWYKNAKENGDPVYISFDSDPNWNYIRPFDYPEVIEK